MKRILAIAALMIVAAGAARADAIAYSNVVVSPTKAMDIIGLRSADLTPGAQTFTTDTSTVSVTLGHVEALTYSEAYKAWINLAPIYGKPISMNLPALNWSDCVNGATNLDWKRGGLQVIPDQCLLSNYIHSQSRR